MARCTQLLRVLRLQLLRSLQIRLRLRRCAQHQLRAGAPQQRPGRGAVLQGTAAAPARRGDFDGKICWKNRIFRGLEHLQMGFKQIWKCR